MLKIWTGGATAVVLVAVSCAHAQDAVQWRVEDGGNGHWYDSVQVLPSVSWTEARDAAGEQGGHLATVTSAEEFLVVHGLAADPSTWNGRVGPWLGGYQDQGPRVIEPDGGWQWVTGEDWYEGWDPQWGEPSNGVPSLPESYLHYIGSPLGSCAQDIPNRHWNDFWEDGFGDSCTPAPKGFIIEWSADCNSDGIVDYGQILDGTYADEDGNGVPDCCEGACPGDLNLDGRVDSADLGLLIAAWNTNGSIVAGSDINGDGIVNAADLGLQIGNWGDCGCN